MEITLPRCDAILKACDDAGVRLCTIFPSRFSAGNRALKDAIDGGRVGKRKIARVRREPPQSSP